MLKLQYDSKMKEFENFPADIHPANYEMKRKEKPLAPRTEVLDPIDEQTLTSLEVMPIDDLKTLVRRLLCQCGAAATMTQEETAQAMLDCLAETALRPVAGANMKADIQSRIAAIDKWLDRTRGKPAQSVDMNLRAAIVQWPLGKTALDSWDIDQESTL